MSMAARELTAWDSREAAVGAVTVSASLPQPWRPGMAASTPAESVLATI